MDGGLTELLRYNAWANRTLIDACRGLSPQHVQAMLPPTNESIAELLAHTVGMQENHVHWTRGQAFESAMGRDSEWPGLDALATLADATSAELIAAAEALNPDGEVDLWHHDAAHRYPIRFLLANIVEHGIRHRTEVTRMLATMGLPAPDLDGWGYGRSVGYGRVVG
jgi:uncharacterized damage-inducible protein DinB